MRLTSYSSTIQGQCQGKSLEGAKLPRGSQGAAPPGGGPGGGAPWWGSGAKPPEADTLFSAKIVIVALSEHVFPY